jgi:hypothetical protein
MEEKLICRICGYEAKKSLLNHLRSFHGLLKKEYLKKYPKFPVFSKEYLKEIGDRKRELITRPGWGEKISQGVKKLWQDPIYKKEHSEAVKKGQNTPEAKENHRKGHNKYLLNRTKQEKEKNREAIIQSWKDPVKRANRVRGLRKAHRSEKVRKNHSEATKKFLAIPENLEARKKKLKETWAEPENRKKFLNYLKWDLNQQCPQKV